MDAATNDLGQLKEKIENTRSDLDQDYKTYYVQTQQEILSMIRKFCTDYNKDRKYSIIISNEPGIIFYKDTTLDITKDLLKGLNDMYVKEKAQSK
jgi:outer membrane protein